MITLIILDFLCRDYKSLLVRLELYGMNNCPRINSPVRLANHVAELTSQDQGHFRGCGIEIIKE